MFDFIKEHKVGITGTVIFHAIIIVLIILFGYTTPLPLPAEEGILINFGDADQGIGQVEPQMSEAVKDVSKEKVKESAPKPNPTKTEEGNLTQDYEDAPAIKDQGVKEEKKETKPVEKPEVKKEPAKEEKPKVEERKVNQNALFPGRDRNTETGTSEGETKGNNNQGSTTGSTDSQNHTGGNSMGNNGPSFSLAGRNPESLPKPDYNYQIEGKVVVEITVDKYGSVTDAVPGVKGSTTLDANLLAAAKRAALKARFDKKPDAPAYQKGTITYYFKLQ